ncbi:hypothetical protein CRG98_050143 [Punica granatum]|uniref:Uncharacterized protein n=1 Tax=Punica granatum TaxID=22663 RepID=A0A2I0GSP7_PUNGR|nr:hypothetical protein CRG98_050143 [Punica granatum]
MRGRGCRFDRGRRYPQRTPETSVEESGSPIGGLNPESTEDYESEVPGRFELAAPTPPPRSSVPTEDVNDLDGEVGAANGDPHPESIEDSESEVPGRFGVRAAHRRPRPLHRGRRYPGRMPATSVEGSGSPIGGPNPSFHFDFFI